MKILGTKIKLLGKTLNNGAIEPNVHVIQNLDKMTELNITTKRMLKRFLGCASYISDHLPYSTKLLHELRTEATGLNNSSVI
jgi:hypothetical protein